jgi:tRNA A-37 threonylcarbamoyl transferase component Bud32
VSGRKPPPPPAEALAQRGRLHVVAGSSLPPVAHLGRYELLAPLAAGGMAEVYRARAVGTGGFERRVVIKRILPDQSNDPEFVSMFISEAKILGMIHHENVVQAYEFGEDNGTLFLALEYVDGPSVSRLLRTLRAANRKIPPVFAAYIAREVCRALAYVHDLKDESGEPLHIVHRDVTPSNIVLTAAGGVKLLDFGVAKFKAAQQLTKTGTVKGKPAYLAPEQLEGKPIDGRVDLFALGIVVHEMLTLEHLFAGDSDLVTVKRIMDMEIPSPSAKRSDVPPELDRIVMRALQRDRRQRYGSAAEMARDLDEVVLNARLRFEDMAAFVAEIEGEAARQGRTPRPLRLVTPLAADVAKGPRTRKDLGLALRMWTLGELFWSRGRRGAVLAGVLLVVLGMAAALGLQIISLPSRGNLVQAAAPAVASPPGRCADPGGRLVCGNVVRR